MASGLTVAPVALDNMSAHSETLWTSCCWIVMEISPRMYSSFPFTLRTMSASLSSSVSSLVIFPWSSAWSSSSMRGCQLLPG